MNSGISPQLHQQESNRGSKRHITLPFSGDRLFVVVSLFHTFHTSEIPGLPASSGGIQTIIMYSTIQVFLVGSTRISNKAHFNTAYHITSDHKHEQLETLGVHSDAGLLRNCRPDMSFAVDRAMYL